MNYCTVQKAGVFSGGRWLFRELSFGLQVGDRLAVVARNGRGKSSLLRMLAGKQQPDEGCLTFRSGLRLVYLPQHTASDPYVTIKEVALSFLSEEASCLRDYHRALGHGRPEEIERLYQKVDESSLWLLDARLTEFLQRLGVAETDRPFGALSGGQQRRVMLAGLLASDADLWLLDEPTNHLDLDLIRWLEEELNSRKQSAMVIVSHDRQFLDATCKIYLEIDDGRGHFYPGGYDHFIVRRTQRLELEKASLRKHQNLLRREEIWAAQTPRARGTKSKARLQALDDLKEAAARRNDAGEIQLKMLSTRLGAKTLELHNISYSLGEREIIRRFSYSFRPGEKVVLAGPNGSGKSTLLKIMLGHLNPSTGKVVLGENTRIGYYDQAGIRFDKDQPVIDFVRDIAEGIYYTQKEYLSASELLKRFDFSPERQHTYLSRLSGGEQKRLYLLSILMQKPNFLMLDEPGNDLDIPTLEKLEDYLLAFPGTIVVATHDRRMMEKLADTTFLFLGNGEIELCAGAYFKQRTSIPDKESSKEKKSLTTEKQLLASKPKSPLSFKEKNELEKLESEIPQLESQAAELNERIASGLLPFPELHQAIAELDRLTRHINQSLERWMELEEKRSNGRLS